jgi:hypothetical protein
MPSSQALRHPAQRLEANAFSGADVANIALAGSTSLNMSVVVSACEQYMLLRTSETHLPFYSTSSDVHELSRQRITQLMTEDHQTLNSAFRQNAREMAERYGLAYYEDLDNDGTFTRVVP